MAATELEIRLSADISELQATLAKTRAELEALRTAGARTGKVGKEMMEGMTISAGQYNAAMRILPAQLTDVATQLAGGQSPFLILMQQGGQVKDSFGGLSNTVKALGPVFTGTKGLMLGTAVAAGLLASSFAKGQAESAELSKSLAMTGNAAGVTAAQMQSMAAQMDQSLGVTQGKANAVLAELAATGQVAGSELQKLGLAALNLERVGGQAASETVKKFAELGKDPVAASAKLNEQINYLTPAIWEQIRALAESGRSADAAALAQKAYAEAIQAQIVPQIEGSLGTLQRAWAKVKGFAAEAWDAMLGIGRKEGVNEAIAKQAKVVEALEQSYARAAARSTGAGSQDASKALSAAKEHLADLQMQSKEETVLARKTAERASANQAGLKALQERQQYTKAAATEQERLNEELKKYRQVVKDIEATGGKVSAAEQKKEEDAIRAKYAKKDKGDSKGPSDNTIATAEYNEFKTKLEAEQKLLQDHLKSAQEQYEQAYKDGLVTLEGYWDAREAIERRKLEAARALRQQELIEAEKRLAIANKGKDKAAQANARAEVAKIKAEVELADNALGRLAAEIETKKQQDKKLLAALKLKVDVELQQLQTGQVDKDLLLAQLKEQYKEVYARFAQDPEMMQKIDTIVSIKLDTQVFEQQLEQVKLRQREAMGPLEAAAGQNERDVQGGRVSRVRGQINAEAINERKSANLEEYKKKLEGLRDELDQGEQTADKFKKKLDLSDEISSVTASLDKLKPQVIDLGVAFEDSFATHAEEAFAAMASGSKSAKEAFADMAKAIIADITKMIIKMLIMKAVKAAMGGFADGGAVAAPGGEALAFADGGRVSGPGGARDDVIPAWLSNGEHVMDARTVQAFGGHSLFNAMRALGQGAGGARAGSHISERMGEAMRNLGFDLAQASARAATPAGSGMLRLADGGAVAGMASISSARSQAMQITNHFSIHGSPADQRTQSQIGAAAFAGANRALRRNG